MSTPRGFRDRSDDSLLTLLGEVPELVRNLIVAEVDSAHPSVAYFVRHGYTVETDEKPKQARARTK